MQKFKQDYATDFQASSTSLQGLITAAETF